MKNSLRLFAVLAAVAVGATLLAQNVTGAWKGKVNIDWSKMPAAKDDAGKKMMEQVKQSMSKMQITLTLNANKTYSAKVSGIPQMKEAQTSEGKWSQSGKNITLTPTKENGKKATSTQTQKLTVSADGKSLTMDMPGGAGAKGVSVVFTR